MGYYKRIFSNQNYHDLTNDTYHWSNQCHLPTTPDGLIRVDMEDAGWLGDVISPTGQLGVLRHGPEPCLKKFVPNPVFTKWAREHPTHPFICYFE